MGRREDPSRVLFVGGWGHHHLRSHLTGPGADPGLELAACGDGVDDMARLIPEHESTITWIDDPDSALDAFAPDVVSVGAVYRHNGRWVERALAAGADVVSDKPVAADHETLARLRALIDRRPTAALATEVDARYDAAFVTAARLVADGAIGAPVLATAQKSYPFGTRPGWYDDPESYPGTVLWVVTHALDFVEFVTGEALHPLSGRSGNLTLAEFPTVADHTVTVCALDGGGTAVVHGDYLRPNAAVTHGDDRLRVAGSDGVIEVAGGRCRLHVGDTAHDVTDDSAGREVGAGLWDTVLAADPVVTEQSLRLAEVALSARAVSESLP